MGIARVEHGSGQQLACDVSLGERAPTLLILPHAPEIPLVFWLGATHGI